MGKSNKGGNVIKMVRKAVRKEMEPVLRLMEVLAEDQVQPGVRDLPLLMKGAEAEAMVAVLEAVRGEIVNALNAEKPTPYTLEQVRSLLDEAKNVASMLADLVDVMEDPTEGNEVVVAKVTGED